MTPFAYRAGELHAEDVPLSRIAEEFGTPCYVYSRAALTASYREFQEALAAHPAGRDGLVCFAVKANSNLGVLSLFARLGAGLTSSPAESCAASWPPGRMRARWCSPAWARPKGKWPRP